MTDREQRAAAKLFANTWKDRGYEKGESQPFWLSLLRDVYGIEHPESFISFEDQVHLDNTSFIDGYIPSTKVLIEQKSLGKDLRKAIRQSDGSMLTPFQQAKRYGSELGFSRYPRWVITCNFESFDIYDMERPNGEPERILLADLEKEYYRLQFLVDTGNTITAKEMEISIKAGDVVGLLYDAFHARYRNPDDSETLKSLNKLCVRLVFCLYAEDAGIFGKHQMFHDYLAQFDTRHMRQALIDLFHVLDQKPEDRDPYLDEDLAAFPYVNGGLFADEDIEIPQFTDEIRDLLLAKASADFDWSEISPTIFGAVFESTLNPETRRSGGMHYTSIENIHKVIDPLFLDALRNEFRDIELEPVDRTRERKLKAFQDKLASLKFLDPAAGSGNFLTETFLSLRRLENEALKILTNNQIAFEFASPIKVSISQFYGIEINDFAVTVAKTALWIAESQMMKETENIVRMDMDFLPLKTNANIVEGNALTLDWNEVVPKSELTYIMGNPPFVGASKMDDKQKKEAVSIFGKIKRANSIDYVGAWYHLAARMIFGTGIRCAFVSTNSITQGEQVEPLWGKLLGEYGIRIDFAYRTFRWDSEANLKAHVHCVIIGFSCIHSAEKKCLYIDETRYVICDNINPYLVDAPDIIVTTAAKPICDVPRLTAGNKPSDGGNLILSEEEKNELINKDPSIEACVRRYIGSKDFINDNEKRYCLWLKGINPSVYRKNTEIMRRLAAVRKMREESTAAPTRALADKPYLFFSAPQQEGPCLCIPEVSSERRRYIPMGFLDNSMIASNVVLIIPEAGLYEFGVLTSNVHMAWMRAVGGRLEMRYRYSGACVYNTFPWPEATDEQKAEIEKTAQEIIDARALYPNSSLADLYDPIIMPSELITAHQHNDKAVMVAYGLKKNDPAFSSESACVAFLMKLYQQKTTNRKV